MASLNIGQDVANKWKIDNCSYIVAKSYPLKQAAGIRRYGSLINIKLM